MPKFIICLIFALPLVAIAETSIRDPMRPYNQPTKAKALQSSFVVNAIFVSSRRKLAIVNGERVRVGETINGALVKEIKANQLTLSLNGRAIILSIGERAGV